MAVEGEKHKNIETLKHSR